MTTASPPLSPGTPLSPLGDTDDDALINILLNRTVGIDHNVHEVSDRFTVGDVLGEGRFGQVRSATRISDGSKCALKGVALEALEEDEETLEILEAEVSALRLVGGRDDIRRHVVQLLEVTQVIGDSLYIVLGLVRGSELFELVERHGALPQPVACALAQQLLDVLAVIHDTLRLVHRDVKPENLMVSGLESADAATLVLIDFGYAAVASPAGGLRGVAGSPEYAAPEVLDFLGERRSSAGYGSSSDVWSVGVTVYVLLVAGMPM
eukprot:1601413-Prymnesium_polylepis.1